jgi:hypothetical protein
MRRTILSCLLTVCSLFAFAQWNVNGNNIYSSNAGNVGVGTGSTVNAKLEVRGASIRLSDSNGDVRYLEISQDADGTPYGRNWANSYAGGRQFKISGFSHLPNNDGSVKKDIVHFDGYNLLFLKDNGGNIGIGTTKPDAKLTVKGIIHTEEVRVDLNVAGPDYVFEEDYKLPSLQEVAAYVKKNKHLPDVPAAKEMEANGVNLGEMNMLLLKKIEELTLYVIELKKEVESLKQCTE